MGAVLKPIGSVLGIGQKDDPTFQPGQANTAAYTKFSQEAHPETEGLAGTQMATDAVQGNAITGKLYGSGGLQDQLQSQGNDLASRGYSLQQPDYEAYGQASGDIARQFGQQEQDTSKMLAQRGLGGASSGAAGAAFSGLAGNKNEMLAKAQTDIAQKRMQDTQQRLQANQQLQASLGAQGNAAIGDQFNRQLQGRQQKGSELQTAMQGEQNINNQNAAAQEQTNQNKSKNIGDALGQGMYSSGQQIGASPGTGASSFSSSMGSSLGSMGMMSDENNKENIRDGSSGVQDFLDSLQSHEYDYKPAAKGLAGAGDGDHFSPMAQELEQTPAGASMVQDTPNGKQVDYGKGFGVLASGLGQLNDRLNRLEGRT